ncbi:MULTISPECIES: hypothetical protein [unclassified Pseudomonas]|uniref:hypothetical protein n=1 Tax=unclassified Pseudomonas TaxID=196821 RepID=UPI003800A6AD
MKGYKGYIGVLGLALLSANVWADLPQSSILSRYGISTDQLPAPAKSEIVEPVEEKSRFQIQPEQPLVNVRLSEGAPLEMTGNPSIDHMTQLDFERCRRLQDELRRRGDQFVTCDNSIPGQLPTR